ncbi:MAG: ABC transporter permease [Chthoniobacterales bacterium]
MAVRQHTAFSFGRVRALTLNTVTELTRMKVFYVVLIFALILIGGSAFMARMSFQQEFQVLKDIALGAMNIFTSLLAIVATARLLPQDIEDRTVYTILAKPVSRFEYLLGKLAGVLLLLAISVIVMSALFFAVLYLREQSVLSETNRQLAGSPPDQITDAFNAIRASAFNTNLLPGVAIIYVKAALLASLTLLISTFASSNIFTIIVTVCVYFIGHLEATAREFWLQSQGAGGVARLLFAVIALFFPDFQLFNLVDDVVVGTAIPAALFFKTAALGCLYIATYLFLAWAVFYRKEL